MFKKTKLKQIIELIEQGYNNTYIANDLDVSRNTVIEVRKRLDELGEQYETLDDDSLYELFFPNKFKKKSSLAEVDYSYVSKELRKVGVTLKLLWEEYVIDCNQDGLKPCSYPTFVLNFQKFKTKKSYTSRLDHKPGEVMEVDWSGPTMKYTDPISGNKINAYLFVACLPYSQKIFVEATTSRNEEAWLNCNIDMLNYYGGLPLMIVCDNCKTAVTSHPNKGEAILNNEYLAFGEYYGVAIRATHVKRPKEKASVEGSVGIIATKIIAKLRNETFNSLEELNEAISVALEDFNNTPFQKRDGSRNIVFENEEKEHLGKLPLVPYEISSWTYGAKVMFNSHVCYKNNFYSVPHQYLGKYVDLKTSKSMLYIYFDKCLIAIHTLLSESVKNNYSTKKEHLDKRREYETPTVDSLLEKAKTIGPCTLEAVKRLLNESKVKEQSFDAVVSFLRLAKTYSNEKLEKAVKETMKRHTCPHYKQVLETIKKQEKAMENVAEVANIRGSDYYK